ncbi:oligopeptide transport system ATP-binding protein [Hydrogenispora ethanolica]|uniref:Oligopeptide transport system ATP-binding protein n=1 Tax=Hydrogenispora ethanolica TaxID=1082276 RepID=A0A4R1RRC8_HYDET|nr:ABC transporter ATP-binding protein [Hydrogenispora ethanolica]TCL68492.1 oligopeptide transport system ATP-binding protein [Hydrogenispora ethanolica]
MSALLEVKGLKTSFYTYAGEVKAVDDVSFTVDSGEAVAIVGESGCGKSVTSLSIMRLIAHPGKITGGSIYFNGKDLVPLDNHEMRRIRGNEIGMIFQDPMTSLNPVLTVKQQLTEGLALHKGLQGEAAIAKAIDLMKLVGIPSPENRLNQYPHQFSGGMRQRVMIAMALACEPKLLIADEPTTALDVTIQAQILEIMKDLKQKVNTAIILITHDLGVVAGLCQKVIVMYAGKIAETGTLRDIFYNPQHPYTWGLLKSVPRLDEETKTKLVPIWGQPPDLLAPPVGCRFRARCDYAMKICEQEQPPQFEVGDGHQAACWLLHQDAPKVKRPTDKGGIVA